jgi:hypothetical protein
MFKVRKAAAALCRKEKFMRQTHIKPRVPSMPGLGISRRRFLTGCAACAGAAGLIGTPGWLRAFPGSDKLRIRIIYALHTPVQDRPDWPNKGFDFNPAMQRINSELTKRCPDFTFIPSMATGPEQTQKILEEDKAAAVDGYLVCQLNCWNQVVQTAATSGKPVLYSDFKFAGSGGFLVYTAGFLRAGTRNVGYVASSRIEDLAEAVRCFQAAKAAGPGFDFAAATTRVRTSHTPKPGDLSSKPDALKTLSAAETIRRMKASKILAVRDDKTGPDTTMMNIPVVQIPFSEVNEAWAAADKDEARAIADRWIKTAALVEGVSRAEIENSAAMYLAEKAVMKKHGANAISINCLGGFYGGHIHAYPCLGFHELNNESLVGGCECDIPSASAMVAIGALTQGRPGYISDPVIDTAGRRIIYAHCVASNKVFGPKGPANPFQILTHSEDRQGASVRSIMPAGYMTTSVEISNSRKEILLHQGKAVGNDPDDRACRTKLVAEPVGDIEKLFTMWDKWGWHRVTFYGDLKEQVHSLADAMGWSVIEEA